MIMKLDGQRRELVVGIDFPPAPNIGRKSLEEMRVSVSVLSDKQPVTSLCVRLIGI